MQITSNEVLKPALWEAELKLGFIRRNGRSLLARRSHFGPLVVQKALYPEGDEICHVIILHPPGGVAGGDRLNIAVEVGAEAHTLLTTPGAGKWYKANGAEAAQQLVLEVQDNALLEWLPQETIVYDAAPATWQARLELAETARYAGWDITCLGRQACGEKFRSGRVRQNLQIYRASRLLWSEQANLAGGDYFLMAAAGLQGCPDYATFVVAAGATAPEILAQCRAIEANDAGRVGVSALPEIFVARYLGHSAQAAREYFELLWAILRPCYAGVAARRPRIWNT